MFLHVLFVIIMFPCFLGDSAKLRKLKPGRKPTQFACQKGRGMHGDSSQRSARAGRATTRAAVKKKFSATNHPDEIKIKTDEEIPIAAEEEIAMEVEASPLKVDPIPSVSSSVTTSDTQTPAWPLLSAPMFQHDPKSMHFYTGLENYEKFKFVLQTLGEAAYHLNYYYTQVQQISVENQFFLTLIKLRRNKTHFELSRLFCVSEYTVTNILITWLNFMERQWKELNLWPTKDLVLYHSPTDFRAKFSSTRAVIDGTECPVQKPKNPKAQQQTFSTYKNTNTVKVLVGASPGGMVTHVSPAYGGSASDRQIVERGDLPGKCDPKDSIMSDKGFNVQDIFAPYDVEINIPAFFKKKNRLDKATLLKDRRIASKRVHIERIIGLGKTYRILRSPMNSTYTKLSSKIIFICYMLCNFKTCIVPKTA